MRYGIGKGGKKNGETKKKKRKNLIKQMCPDIVRVATVKHTLAVGVLILSD